MSIALIYLSGVFCAYLMIRIYNRINRGNASWTVADRIISIMFASASWAIIPFYTVFTVITIFDKNFFYREGMGNKAKW